MLFCILAAETGSLNGDNYSDVDGEGVRLFNLNLNLGNVSQLVVYANQRSEGFN